MNGVPPAARTARMRGDGKFVGHVNHVQQHAVALLTCVE